MTQSEPDLPAIGNLSKAERGHALFAPQKSAAAKAAPIDLPLGATIEEAFQLIVRGCLQQVQDNAAGVVRGDEPECVHQMRVGLRRLRTALKLFEPSMAPPRRLRRELSWLANVLGQARDADVLASTLLPRMLGPDSADAGLAALHEAACQHAADSHRAASLAVSSVRYSRLLLELVAWVHHLGWRKRLDFEGLYQLTLPIERSLLELLEASHYRLLKRGKQLKKGDARARHKFRIAVKNARYTATFFSSALDRGRCSRYTDRLATLQQHLGDLNDARSGQQQLQALAREQPALAESARRATTILAQGKQRDLQRMTQLWRRARAIEPPLKLAKHRPMRRPRAAASGQRGAAEGISLPRSDSSSAINGLHCSFRPEELPMAKQKAVPAKTSAKAAAKPINPVKAKTSRKPSEAAAKSPEPTAVKKAKLVRDSFTIPKIEYQVLDKLKKRAASLDRLVKKSELLRAGIAALDRMEADELIAALNAVPAIKTGRPAK